MRNLKKTAGLYCRVSTEMQVERGESIEAQQERLSQYAEGEGFDARLYVDAGFSAKDTNRPQLQKLLADVKAGKIDKVVVTKLDRISRNLKDIIDLTLLFEEHNVGFKSITQPFDTSSAMGRAQVQLMGVFAQLEREMTSERVSEDMRRRAANGKWNGGVVTYGYMAQSQQKRIYKKYGKTEDEAEELAKKKCPEAKKLYVNPEQAKVVQQIFDKYINTESLRSVTHWLNSKRIPSLYGTTWASSSVSRVLSNVLYIGKVLYNKRVSSKVSGKLKNRPKKEWIIADGQHDPIIKKVKFDKVQAILERQASAPSRKRSEYLLSGIIKCGQCGHRMNGYTHRKKNDLKSYSYYKCAGKQQKGASVCQGSNANRHELELAVESAVLSLTKGRQMIKIEQAHRAYNKKFKKDIGPMKEELEKLNKESLKIEGKKSTLLQRLEDDTISPTTYKERIKEHDDHLKQNKREIYDLESKINDSSIDSISFDMVYEAMVDFKKNWKHLDIIARKELLKTLVSGVVYKGHDQPVEVSLYFKPLLPHGQGFMAAINRTRAG